MADESLQPRIVGAEEGVGALLLGDAGRHGGTAGGALRRDLVGVELKVARELPDAFDVLLASDVLYEVGNRQLIERELARGGTVLVSDPLRFGNPRLSLEPRCTYEVRTMPDVDYPVHSAVIYHFSP